MFSHINHKRVGGPSLIIFLCS